MPERRSALIENLPPRDGESKPCLAGCGNLIYREGMGPKHFAETRCCSRRCAGAYRKGMAATAAQQRGMADHMRRSKAAMNAHWQIQRERTAAKGRVPLRVSREDEVAAMERFLAERGVTACPAPEAEADPVRTTNDRPGVMPGWRG